VGDSCGPDASSTAGCDNLGNNVWHSLSADGNYLVNSGPDGHTLDALQRYITVAVPYDYEVRFTEGTHWGVFAFEDDMICTVPFELWNTGIGTPDDPSDDRRVIPFINNNDATGPVWGWGTGNDDTFGGHPMSDWIYFMEPDDQSPGSASYDQFAAVCESIGAGGTYPYATDGSAQGYFADFGYRGAGGFVYPIGRLVFTDYGGVGSPPPAGTTVRIITTKPNSADDSFTFDTGSFLASGGEEPLEVTNFKKINVFPNPYKAYNPLESPSNSDEQFVTFTHLPESVTIRIYSLSGLLIRTLVKSNESPFMQWDLKNESDLRVASGLYLAHIESSELDMNKTLKIAVIQRVQTLERF
jgi:hypothetical protein